MPKLSPHVIPPAPKSIQKGVPLKSLLNDEAVRCLALNIQTVDNGFDVEGFCDLACRNLEPLSLMSRGQTIAHTLHAFLPNRYSDALAVLVASLTQANDTADEFGSVSRVH